MSHDNKHAHGAHHGPEPKRKIHWGSILAWIFVLFLCSAHIALAVAGITLFGLTATMTEGIIDGFREPGSKKKKKGESKKAAAHHAHSNHH